MLFIYLNFDVLVFSHLPTIVVFDHKPLSNEVFNNVFEGKGIPNIFCFLVRAINIEQIFR